MIAKFENWNAGCGDVYCFTSDVAVHRELSRVNPTFATYEKGGRVIGWQHRIARCALPELERRVGVIRALDLNELQPSENGISIKQGDLFGGDPLVTPEEQPPQNEAA